MRELTDDELGLAIEIVGQGAVRGQVAAICAGLLFKLEAERTRRRDEQVERLVDDRIAQRAAVRTRSRRTDRKPKAPAAAAQEG